MRMIVSLLLSFEVKKRVRRSVYRNEGHTENTWSMDLSKRTLKFQKNLHFFELVLEQNLQSNPKENRVKCLNKMEKIENIEFGYITNLYFSSVLKFIEKHLPAEIDL